MRRLFSYLLVLLLNRLASALRGRPGRAASGEGSASGAAGALAEVHEPTNPERVCACALREFLNANLTTSDLLSRGIPRGVTIAWRGGTLVPTESEKRLIVEAANEKFARRPRATKHFEYADVFGPEVKPRICSCEIRQLLGALAPQTVALALGLDWSDVAFQDRRTSWRAGATAPTEAQLAILRKLVANGAEVVAFSTKRRIEPLAGARCEGRSHDRLRPDNPPPPKYCCIRLSEPADHTHTHICGTCALHTSRTFFDVAPILECSLLTTRRQA